MTVKLKVTEEHIGFNDALSIEDTDANINKHLLNT